MEIEKPFALLRPKAVRAPFLFSSPHSGRTYPCSFLKASRLDAETLRRSEDSFVDELFDGVVALGAPLLKALFPRAYLDPNREPYELDPRMFSGRLPHFANTRSLRVAGGLGTIARIVADAQEIYRQPLSVEEALARIERYYRPYHRALGELMAEQMRDFGIAVLIDCHSMPSSATGEDHTGRPDIVLGDRYGTSCARHITDFAQQVLEKLGYQVRRNKPYAGGYITERYGNPARNFHALQIEINRGLYMDESRFEKQSGFARLKADLTALARELIEISPSWPAARCQAAE
ncbi:MAG TPA: N-formylglutamate amidohydrolase [Hyphomicrobiales bacterium]|mgnify:CR=1 FL=1|nr:N-formylglutamate amidohydrolase [Hyphomicrobiales bacterium]